MKTQERYYGHDRAMVVTQPTPGVFEERPMTTAERVAREPAAKIQDDIYRHANYAGACYHEIWELIAAAIQAGIDESMRSQDKMTDVERVLHFVHLAMMKFPRWPTDPLHALAVLGEEYGELTKAVLQMIYEPHKTSAEDVETEAFQTAAMALRLVMSLGRYEYTRCPQHDQNSQPA